MDLDARLVIEEDPRVYRPSDDSHLLLESVLVDLGERFLEVGTGTGLVALHAAAFGPVVATDVNAAAVRVARANASRNDRAVAVVRTNLAAGLRGPFDVVVFNPPYLEGRPAEELDRAWAGGEEGSEVTVRFLRDLPRVLAATGRAYLLLSRANVQARRLAETCFRTRLLATKRLFFEDLDVLELRPRDP